MVTYHTEPELPPEDFARVLAESGLGAQRPLADAARLAAMLANAGLILTARQEGRLIGVARCITDFAWCAYISELAVCPSAQGLGAGQGLLRHARAVLGPQVGILLVSVPEAAGFYERAGMQRLDDAFWHHRET
jgi:GNAT superfamily N-acetyltransferase